MRARTWANILAFGRRPPAVGRWIAEWYLKVPGRFVRCPGSTSAAYTVPDHCMVVGMPKRPTTPHRRLGAFIASERLRAGLTQQDVVAALDQPQQWLSRIESGRRQRVDVVELLVLADVIGFDAVKALRVLQRSPQRRQWLPARR
jgi:Helix-turn-helix domain